MQELAFSLVYVLICAALGFLYSWSLNRWTSETASAAVSVIFVSVLAIGIFVADLYFIPLTVFRHGWFVNIPAILASVGLGIGAGIAFTRFREALDLWREDD